MLTPFIRDTALLTPDVSLDLERLDRATRQALRALGEHPFPQLIIHLDPGEKRKAGPVALASLVVGLRAERLTQLVELSASALHNLERRSIQVAAIAARALLELAVLCLDGEEGLREGWREARATPDLIRAVAADFDSSVWASLWTSQFGTRLEPELNSGWPQAVNIVTRLKRICRDPDWAGIQTIYDWLCEATHPNVEAQGAFWRPASPDRYGRSRVRFEPTKSQSPVKVMITEAVCVSSAVLLEFARILWWMAVDIVDNCPHPRDADTRALGLPVIAGRTSPCICGSGEQGGTCRHPEPFGPGIPLNSSDVP